MYRNLGDFIIALDKAGELKRIHRHVSPVVEISRYTNAESKSPGGGKALLFTDVEASDFPVATNLFGSAVRICMALGVAHLDELAGRVREYIHFNPPQNFREAIQALPMALELTSFVPRRHRGARPPCQEVVHTGSAVDLSSLPVLTCWPGDAGPFVTLPLVFTRSLETGKRNVGMYRLQVFDRNTTGMHWHIHKDGSHYFSEYARAGKRMPVAVAIGADPATTYAATAPLPRGVDEMLLAGFIRKKPVRMTQCLTVDMAVPAEAEFVLEGYVDPGERRREGPFGDHTGYYSLADDYPVFHVTALTHRRRPVYSATLVGPPPMEDCYLAKATERLFLPMLQAVFPEIRDYWFPWEGVFHNIVVVALDKAYAGHALKIMSGLWGQGQMSFCKAIVVVDGAVDPGDGPAVLNAFLERFDPDADMTVTKGVLDVLDHSSPFANYGSKLGIDLTGRTGSEPPRRQAEGPADPAMPERLRRKVAGALGADTRVRTLAATRKGTGRCIIAAAVARPEGVPGRELAAGVLDALGPEDPAVVLLLDHHIDIGNPSLVLWKLFNNTDPERDIHRVGASVVVDAMIKGPADGHQREWPAELTFDMM